VTDPTPAAPGAVPEEAVADLRDRLRRFRTVPLIRGTGWARGTDAAVLDDLVRYWADEYDWRVHERRIRALPWRTTALGMRFVDRPGPSEDAPVVVLLHGWPDSVLRFERVLPLLEDVRVVVPALPGYPWGLPVREAGLTTGGTADLVAALLDEIGVARVVVSAGDVGSSVAESLAAQHPGLVAALHLTNVPTAHYSAPPPGLDEDEQRAMDAAQAWMAAEAGYSHEQGTKPHTLAVGLGDSPAGLLAWIVEKLRAWSDCDGDVEAAFPRDDLLTWVSAYWFTGTIGTSFTPYVEERETVDEPIPVPTAFTWFPEEMLHAPRSFAARFFDVRVWEERDRGGHFAAWEQPESFVAGLRGALALASRP
jgi:pimeloyl-ACP methyl ester carboxylesterase